MPKIPLQPPAISSRKPEIVLTTTGQGWGAGSPAQLPDLPRWEPAECSSNGYPIRDSAPLLLARHSVMAKPSATHQGAGTGEPLGALREEETIPSIPESLLEGHRGVLAGRSRPEPPMFEKYPLPPAPEPALWEMFVLAPNLRILVENEITRCSYGTRRDNTYRIERPPCLRLATRSAPSSA
jgi:hypothetical protein